ncbi:MAG TPA: hypothetical protein VHF47_09685 [Acidimicrobiales bacterium]|nr:hypothetical protein [Acidimicrobiales bacterium]
MAAYREALAPEGTFGSPIGTVPTPMSSTGGLYVHDAPTRGLIYYEKDQQKLREEALEHANRKVPESAVPIIVVPLPVPVPLPG